MSTQVTSLEKTISINAFNALLNAMQMHHIPHLVDYMGEIHIPNNTVVTRYILEDSPGNNHWDFYTFDTLEAFTNYLQRLLDTLDLTSGGDDQYFDYNKAQLEAILYMLYQLNPLMVLHYKEYEDKDFLNQIIPNFYTQLKQIFDNYFENDKSHDRDDTYQCYLYQCYLDNIDFKEHTININCLEISKL